MTRPRPSPPAPPSASARERHLDLGSATVAAGCVAALGLSLSTLGNPLLGFFLFLAAVLLLAVDAVVAVQVTRRVRLTAAASHTDLVVGDPFTVTVAVSGPPLAVVLASPGAEALATEAPASGHVSGTARVRSVVHRLPMEVTSHGLSGLVGCVRLHTVVLARPLEIGPRPVPPAHPLPELGGGWGEGVAVPSVTGDLVRGVREYLPGDRLRQVHWRATARPGQLVVKESEETQAPLLHLVLDLGGGGPGGEAAAGRAAWYGGEALRRGYQLVLTTSESGRTVTAPAPSPVTLNRRLARAEPGRPTPVKGSGQRTRLPGRVLLVSDQGDSWP